MLLRFFSEITDADSLTLWMSADGEAWRDIAEIEDSVVSPFTAYIEALEPNRDYQFRLEVVGGPMAGLSNTLDFPYYDTDPDREGGGDRDNGDRDDQGEEPPAPAMPTSPDMEPPATPPPTGNSPASVKPNTGRGTSAADSDRPRREASGPAPEQAAPSIPEKAAASEPEASASTAALPDRRVFSLTAPQAADQLAANPESLTITQNGIKAVISAAALERLALSDDDIFSAELEMPEPDRFSVRFWVGEAEITGFGEEPFVLHIPYAAEPESMTDVFCQKAEETLPAAGYENGKLVFALQTTGEYVIRRKEAPAAQQTAMIVETPPEEQPEEVPAPAVPRTIPVAVFLLLGGCIGVGAYRRNGVKR